MTKDERIERLEAALREIAESPYCQYENNSGSQYGIGVTDGHRLSAQIAREALADDGMGECPTCGGSGLLDGYDPYDPPPPGCGEPCPDCSDDDTPPANDARGEALEAFEEIAEFYLTHTDGWSGKTKRAVECVRRALNEPAVPESIRRLPDEWETWTTGSEIYDTARADCARRLRGALTQSQQGGAAGRLVEGECPTCGTRLAERPKEPADAAPDEADERECGDDL